jgi:photosystem II stability/assembly factor-like uncharacterized protein
MAQFREHRRAAGSAWLLILAVVLAGCGGAVSRQTAGERPRAAPVTRPMPSAGRVRSRVALESLRMATRRVGWAVSVGRDGYPLTVVRTADGGLTWRDAGPPGLSGQGLRAAFYSARDAWVTWSRPFHPAWPVTYKTTDAGRTWTRMGSIGIRAIGASAPDMVTGRLGWVTAGLGAAAGSSGMALFRTVDGGARWQLAELTTGHGRLARGAIPFGCDKGDAVFSGPETGWVAGSCAGGRPAFWVTRDGGRAWQYQSLPRPSGTEPLASCQCLLTPPVFVSPSDGALWILGEPAFTAAAYLTRNGGRTWTPIRLPGSAVPVQTPDFANSQDGFVIGGQMVRDGQPAAPERLYATTDGGAAWAVRSASPIPAQPALDFLTPSFGFATSIRYGPLRPYLLETTNGGATWTSLPASRTG